MNHHKQPPPKKIERRRREDPMRCEQSELSLRGHYFTYVLRSKKNKNLYVGCTKNLKRRLKEHSLEKSKSTKHLHPLKLIYLEACPSSSAARKREQYLKTSWGKRYLNNRIVKYLEKSK